jgi:hypothetical protein
MSNVTGKVTRYGERLGVLNEDFTPNYTNDYLEWTLEGDSADPARDQKQMVVLQEQVAREGGFMSTSLLKSEPESNDKVNDKEHFTLQVAKLATTTLLLILNDESSQKHSYHDNRRLHVLARYRAMYHTVCFASRFLIATPPTSRPNEKNK